MLKNNSDELKKALKNEEEFYFTYQSNIAMAFYDAYYNYRKEVGKGSLNKGDLHTIVNNATKYFLDLFISQ